MLDGTLFIVKCARYGESGQERLLGFLFILQGVFLKRGRVLFKRRSSFKKRRSCF